MPSISCPHSQSWPSYLLNSIPVRQSVFTELLSAWSWLVTSNISWSKDQWIWQGKADQRLVFIHAPAAQYRLPGPPCSWRDAPLAEDIAHKHTSVPTQSQRPQHDLDIWGSAVVLSPNPPASTTVTCFNSHALHFLHLHVFCFIWWYLPWLTAQN